MSSKKYFIPKYSSFSQTFCLVISSKCNKLPISLTHSEVLNDGDDFTSEMLWLKFYNNA